MYIVYTFVHAYAVILPGYKLGVENQHQSGWLSYYYYIHTYNLQVQCIYYRSAVFVPCNRWVVQFMLDTIHFNVHVQYDSGRPRNIFPTLYITIVCNESGKYSEKIAYKLTNSQVILSLFQ